MSYFIRAPFADNGRHVYFAGYFGDAGEDLWSYWRHGETGHHRPVAYATPEEAERAIARLSPMMNARDPSERPDLVLVVPRDRVDRDEAAVALAPALGGGRSVGRS